MVDLAKIADLALLLVDGSYGLQMETFEFLNLLQLHGFPKVAGVLTNLDCPRFQKNRTALQTVRKSVKQRLWTESHKGNKMFEFCGGLTGGKYKKNEVQRLALFVSRVKFRPLVWRNAHPYVLVDRIELLPQRNGKKLNDTNTRDVTLFGYVRGSRLRSGGSVHLAGAGDFSLDFDAVSALPDPCPLASSSTNGGAFQKDSVKEKKKNKSAALHAPMADSGRVSVDREGGLSIELRTVTYTKKEMLPLIHQAQINQDTDRGVVSNGQPTPVDLLRSMQDVSHSLDQQLKGSKGNLQLFAGEGQRGHDEYDIGDDGDDNRHDNESAIDDSEYENAENDGPEVDDNEDEDGSDDNSDDVDEDGSDDDEGEIYDEKNNLWSDDDEGEDEDVGKDRSRPSANSTDAHSSCRIDWMTEVYGKDWINKSNHKKDGDNKNRKELDSDDEELGGLFKLVGKNRSNSDEKSNLQRFNEIDSSRSFLVVGQKRNPIMSNEESNTHEILRGWVGEAVSKLDEEDQAGDRSSEDSGEKVSANSSSLLQLLKLRYVTGGWLQSTLSASDNDNTVAKRSDKSQSGDVDGSDDEDEMEKMNLKIDADLRKENASRKAAFKASFDLKYDQGKIVSKIACSIFPNYFG
jgi:ribosome biogenesis protein BMS1